jgi:hypothetical protein
MKQNTKRKLSSSKKQNKTKKRFLFNPDDPDKSFDVYIDKNPNDTIPIKYTTLEDVGNTIDKLEKLYKAKKYPHKRIWQVGMIMKVRLKVLQSKKPKQYALANKYFKFLGNRTKLDETDRYKASFQYTLPPLPSNSLIDESSNARDFLHTYGIGDPTVRSNL